jgi:2-polyprenyl-6-methoxyphenol hydroxylase-like FAD-dependent oxidoreductase
MKSTQVLVVGAGPVGFLAALCLRAHGVDVTVVDDNERTDAKSFAVVLHPRTVALLADLGITSPLLWQGQSFERVVVYSEAERRATLEMLVPNAMARGGLTLPRNGLRRALEAALRDQAVEVLYRHRLISLERGQRSVRARLSRGDSMPEATTRAGGGEPRGTEIEAEFVVGADGHDSFVRKALGIAMVEQVPPETFTFFDVLQGAPARLDAELVVGDLSSAAYPLHDGITRFVYQTSGELESRVDAALLSNLRRSRTPWHSEDPERVEWTGTRRFRKAVADRFGSERVWLAGDAGHTTSPLGAQSLNVGLREARDLAASIAECFRRAPIERLRTGYDAQRRLEWRRLMGLDAPGIRPNAPAWARRHFRQLLAALPASGDDLDDLLAQLGITTL